MSDTKHLAIIQAIVRDIKKNDVCITATTDLLEEKILDSLDGLIFFMELDSRCGIVIPEDVDLAREGYFNVAKLLKILDTAK